jgi:hypothetical protein
MTLQVGKPGRLVSRVVPLTLPSGNRDGRNGRRWLVAWVRGSGRR